MKTYGFHTFPFAILEERHYVGIIPRVFSLRIEHKAGFFVDIYLRDFIYNKFIFIKKKLCNQKQNRLLS